MKDRIAQGLDLAPRAVARVDLNRAIPASLERVANWADGEGIRRQVVPDAGLQVPQQAGRRSALRDFPLPEVAAAAEEELQLAGISPPRPQDGMGRQRPGGILVPGGQGVGVDGGTGHGIPQRR